MDWELHRLWGREQGVEVPPRSLPGHSEQQTRSELQRGYQLDVCPLTVLTTLFCPGSSMLGPKSAAICAAFRQHLCKTQLP
eukprot:6382047-Amphidinium_carterae.1